MDAAGTPVQTDEERRLLWRCRRGTRELDVLLERYAQGALSASGAAERAVFMKLLELPDPLLTDYLLGWATPEDADLLELVRRIRATPPSPGGRSGSPGAAQASSLKGPC